MLSYHGYQPPIPVAGVDQGLGVVYDSDGEFSLRLSRIPTQPTPENGYRTSISLLDYFGSLNRVDTPYEQATELLVQATRYAEWYGGVRHLHADGSSSQTIAGFRRGDAPPPLGNLQPSPWGTTGRSPNFLGQSPTLRNYVQVPSYGGLSAPVTSRFGGESSRSEYRSQSPTHQTHSHTVDSSVFFGCNGSGWGDSRSEHCFESSSSSAGTDLPGFGSMLSGILSLGGNSRRRHGNADYGGFRDRRRSSLERRGSLTSLSPSPPPPSSQRYTGTGGGSPRLSPASHRSSPLPSIPSRRYTGVAAPNSSRAPLRAPPSYSNGMLSNLAGGISGFNRTNAGRGEFRNPRERATRDGNSTRNVTGNIHGFNRIHADHSVTPVGDEDMVQPSPQSSFRPRDEPRSQTRLATSGGRTLGPMNARRGEGYSTRPSSPPPQSAPSSGRQFSQPQSLSAATSRQEGQGPRVPGSNLNLNSEASATPGTPVSGNSLQMLLNIGMSREAAMARLETARRNHEGARARNVDDDVGMRRRRDNEEHTRDSNEDGLGAGRRWRGTPQN
ncbi:hypothetical protein BGZ60DRAFT_525650 [Tricladium varicosporioides]|nr:hypothetical protein BGZ60DRAFT_525650 [Hymenoscyphus varicosporioides]